MLEINISLWYIESNEGGSHVGDADSSLVHTLSLRLKNNTVCDLAHHGADLDGGLTNELFLEF